MPSLGSLLPPRRRVGPGVVVAVAGTAAVAGALLPFRESLGTTTAGLAFVVPVVVATALGGAPASVVAVLVGFLAYNVLFTVPYYTVAVAHVPDVVGLVVYVLVGGVTALIVSLRQQEAETARQREREALAVFDLSRSLISELTSEAVVDAVVTGIERSFDVHAVAVFVAAQEGEGLRLARAAGLPLPDEVMSGLTSGARGPWSPALRRVRDVEPFPLVAAGRVRGVLVVWGSVPPGGHRVLTAFANQAALALHRAELAGEALRVEALEQADRVRAALIRSVSHDLRTPLASISAAAEDLSDVEVPLAEDDRRVLAATIVEESQRLDRLVANLLDMGRLEAGRLEVRPEAVEVVELVQAAAGGQSAELVVDLPPELPPVEVDPVLMEQVFRNLLDNARRFSPAAGTVAVRGCLRDGSVEVAVADRGPGVAPAERERIFDLFHQAAPDAWTGGVGLGLAICRGYVEAHGARIWVEDTDGGGATFVLRLPAASDLPQDLVPAEVSADS